MSDDGPSGGDVTALAKRLDDFQKSWDEWREAQTPKERKDARDDVDEAQENLEKLAMKMGISPAALRQATADAKRAERKDELRPIIQELLDELVGDDDDEKKPDEEPAPVAEVKPKREPKPKTDDPPPPDEDEVPSGGGHWTEKVVNLWG